MNVFNALRYWTLHLTPEGAKRVKQRLYDIIEELEKEQSDDGLRVHIATYMSTTLSETQALYQKLTGEEFTSETENCDEEEE